jgi:hypothetical protein
MSITAIVQDDTIHLPKGIHFPDGTRVSIAPVKSPTDGKDSGLGERLKQFVGVADDLPTDLARNLDHYVHGQAKQP